jgi:YD repeat-containing protein
MRIRSGLAFLLFVTLGFVSNCKAELGFAWAEVAHPPGPFYREGFIPLIMKSYGKDWIDSRTNLPMHFVVSCPSKLSYVQNSVFVRLDINLVFENGFWGASYTPRCWYDIPSYYIANPDENLPTSCPANPSVGNPISISNGNKTQREVDVYFNNSLELSRFYSFNGNLGLGGWSSTFDRRLSVIDFPDLENSKNRSKNFSEKSGACSQGWADLKSRVAENWVNNSSAVYDGKDSCKIVKNGKVVKLLPILNNSFNSTFLPKGIVQLTREDGSLINFYLNAGQWVTTTGERGRLTRYRGESGTEGWLYTSADNVMEVYSAYGKLVKIIYPNGPILGFQYETMDAQLPLLADGRLLSVRDNFNNVIDFSYGNNLLNRIAVNNVEVTSFTYGPSGLISTVTRPDNTTRIYHYEDSRFPTALTGITDERGKRYATWAYDAQGRAISSEHAGGADKTLLTFNADGSTTVTNALNKKTIYRFDDIAGARRVVKVEGQPTANCAGANQDYTYTAEGWVASKTDWKGIKTTYQYNAIGQEISRTEAYGTAEARTITTEWHPTLYLKTKVTEPTQETTFTYDANGRLLNQSVRALTN